MADRKISDLTALTTPASGDYLPIVDISEASAANKNKRITIEELLRGAPDGTAGAPGIAFESDPNTGIYSPGADQLAISTNGTGRLFVDASGNVTAGNPSSTRLEITSGSVGVGERIHSYTNNYYVWGIRNETNALCIESAFDGAIIFRAKNDGVASSPGTASERMRLDSSGRLGLGTSSPSAPLTVSSSGSDPVLIKTTVSSSYNSLIFENDTGSKVSVGIGGSAVGGVIQDAGYVGTISNKNFFINTNNTARIAITNAGLVGIGTTGPIGILSAKAVTNGNLHIRDINSIVSGTGVALDVLNDAGTTVQDLALRGATTSFHRSGGESARIDSSGRLLVGTSTSRQVTIGESAGWDPRVQVTKTGTDGGNIAAYSWSTYNTSTGGGQGIGPDIVLARSNSNTEGTHVALTSAQLLGRITFNGSNGSAFAAGAYIAATADDAWASGDHPTRLVFSTTADGASSPTERMRVTNGGRIDIWGGSTVNTINCVTPAAAGTTYYLVYGGHSSSGVGNYGTQSFGVWSNGDVINTNNSYGAISDAKLKENIVDANSQWDDIKALQVRNYNFKEGQTHTQIGLIAQEVELISPGLVSESPDRDAEGNDLGTVTKSVNYSVLYMKAVKALQEAMERIETLEAKVAALESA
jgi:hypothetical protein